ncbi:probable G-protein coupled receptor Mth-like 3 [Formica exsecta]|uniref:probable G-protein coupled receptor Mth-like 3 n=1 Tax=Formica exsecta TaxID=72781 RepID=UPI001142D2F9|nr:probable G-protein coupled receptor Mth-like 3 [Formica exsecta]
MYGKSLAFWYYMLPLITSSSKLWPSSTSDDMEKNYSTVQYQFDANTMRNYDDEEDLIQYYLHENSTKDNNVMQYAHHINFTSNNSKNNEDLIQYKFQTHVAKKHENDSQTPVQYRINSRKASGKKNFMSREIHGNLKGIKGENGSTSYDFLKNFDGYNFVLDEMCDNIVCIRLCCPFGNRLVNGKCIAEQGEFIFLETMYGYSNDSLLNESKQVDDLFLLIVDDPCQKTGHYVLNSHQNTLLINGSLYLPYYNTIVESTSYCLAVVDYDMFVINVCFDVMEEIMNKTINHNKNIISPEFLPESWMYTKDNSNRDNNKNSIVLDKLCDNITCIRLCCPFGNRLIKEKCIAGQGNFIFLQNMFGYINDSMRNESKSVDKLFLLVVHDPCQNGHYFFYPTQQNVLLDNGSWYLHNTKDIYYNRIIESTSYCLAIVNTEFSDKEVPQVEFTVNVCRDIASKFIKRVDTPINQDDSISTSTIVSICGFLGSLLFSLVMFIVYSIVPELRNIHGFILCGYSSSIVIVNTVDMVKIFNKRADIADFICIAYAFVRYYFLLTSWFWLTVMSIDIWRTFGHSLQRDVKQQERKKLILYSAYGWGGPFMLAIICGILDFVPGVSENFRPKFDKDCWFAGYITRMLCVHGIVTICIISIICLCINTARKIAHYEKDIAHHQRNLESRRYKDNKQWFNLYLKATKILFIIFCIKLPMNVLSFEVSCTVRYTLLMLDVIQQFLIFTIFVWKKKIGKLLLKRFGCQS